MFRLGASTRRLCCPNLQKRARRVREHSGKTPGKSAKTPGKSGETPGKLRENLWKLWPACPAPETRSSSRIIGEPRIIINENKLGKRRSVGEPSVRRFGRARARNAASGLSISGRRPSSCRQRTSGAAITRLDLVFPRYRAVGGGQRLVFRPTSRRDNALYGRRRD